MNIGQAVIWLAFFSTLAAAYFFYREGKDSTTQRVPRSGHLSSRRIFAVAVAAVSSASALMLYFLFNHQFQFAYVAKYSSTTQPLMYLISAFWAGQEGTFLLWALLVSILGMVFLRTKSKEDGFAMSIVSAFLAFLYLLMIVKSPFETTTAVPADGQGMNPLLQDPWMAIHPPILFVGYAATVFPFALAISGLARRKYDQWFASGFVWTVFASLTLGAGIIIGGFWAYEVLGWGGYWGWDPVENSSLVPWLTLLALIHGFLVQKAKGSLVRTNIFFALISFLLVLYATFLTRSGVLADFSVHSFENLGIGNHIIGAMVVSLVLAFGLFITRFRDFHSPKVDISTLNREVTLVLSLFALSAAAAFIFVGMSSPILTGLFGKASQVDTTFYNKVNLPVAIGIALLLAVTPFLGWTEEKNLGFVKRLSMPVALTLLALAIAYVGGVTTPMLMLFVGSAAFGLISNVIIAFRQYRSGWTHLGGPVAHIGIGLLLIGIIGSGKFDQTSQVILVPNQPQDIYGYHLTFKGIDDTKGIKQRVLIEVSDGKSSYMAQPRLYFSEYNQSVMREPDIKVYPLSDLYLSPMDLKMPEHEHSHGEQHELTKGETKSIGGYEITFARFDVGQHQQTGAMMVGAVLEVKANGQSREVIPQLSFSNQGERNAVPVDLPPLGTTVSRGAQIALGAISVEEKKVLLQMFGADEHSAAEQSQPPQLILEVSTKPLMMVVWTGVVLIIGGTLLSFVRRLKVPEGA